MFNKPDRKTPWLVATVVGLALAPAALATTSFAYASPTKPATPVTGAAALRYQRVDLGTLGGESSFATGMNDRGAVIGRSQTADGSYHGFVWKNGIMSDLGPLSPNGINNVGAIIGTREDAAGGYLWSRGTLKTIPGGLRYPTSINDRGDIVGIQIVDDHHPDVPVLISRGKVRQLPLDDVSDVNNRRMVSGGVLLPGLAGFHASVWRRGKVTDLGAAAFNRSNTAQINDRGWVIGFVFSAEQFERGSLWRNGKRTDLGTLGGELTHPIAINEQGTILVTSQVADGNIRPALWRRGTLVDLSTQGVDTDGVVTDYNDRGEIAGSIQTEYGVGHAVVYRPVRRS